MHRPMSSPVVSFVFFGCFLAIFVSGQTLVDGFPSAIQSCETACDGAYPGGEEQQVRLSAFCRNGCRLLNVIDVLDGFDDLNDTKVVCYKCCEDSFALDQSIEACRFGCDSQASSAELRRKQLEEYRSAQHLRSLSLTLYIGAFFSGNILNSDGEASSESNAQALDGTIVVFAQSSSVLLATGDDAIEDTSYEYVEARGSVVIGPVVAVPSPDADDRPSSLTVDEPREGNLALKSDVVLHSCVILRTGVSRILAVFLFILFVLLVVWVWTNPPDAVTKQDHRLSLEKQNLIFYQFCEDEDELKAFVDPSPNDIKSEPHLSAVDSSHSKRMELIDIGSPFPVEFKAGAV